MEHGRETRTRNYAFEINWGRGGGKGEGGCAIDALFPSLLDRSLEN